MSSLEALLEDLRERGVELWLEAGGALRYRGPGGVLTAELKEELRRRKAEVIALLERRADPLLPRRSPAEPFEPFPLTPLQAAYWLGEKDFYGHRTPAFFAQEYRLPGLDLERFRAAVAAVVETHEVLRLRIGDDGRQRIDPRPAAPSLRVEDLRGRPGAEVRAAIERRRETIEDELPPLESGPPFAFAVQLLDGEVRLHVALRLIAFDGISTAAFYRAVAGRYQEGDFPLAASPLSYRDYVLTLEAYRESAEYRRALAYWQARLDTLPPAPDLPQLPTAASPGDRVEFRRLTTRLPRARWQALQQRARAHGLPINTLLCALFTETVRRWSTSRDFTLNVLVSNRPAASPDYALVMGNCSSTALLQADAAPGPFAARVTALQRQLYADLEHRAVAGVEVIRRLQQRRPAGDRPLMPVVFTSALDLAESADGEKGFHFPLPGAILTHSALKTPQVWLDQQVYEEGGDLICNWDFLPAIFPPGMIEGMHRHHRRHLEELAAGDPAWEAAASFPLPDEELAERQRANATGRHLEDGLLQSFFHRRAEGDGERIALVDGGVDLSYQELAAAARLAGQRLAAAGIRPGDLVGVLAAKSWRQLAAVLGVLEAGGAYLPLDAKLPPARVAQIVAASGARAVLTDRPESVPAGCPALPLPERGEPGTTAPSLPPLPPPLDPGALAYVIYTSGSTGAPKGVMIDHRGAVNTVLDVVERFGVGRQDRVLALSSLGFDLSVFDLFGTLAAGGTVVVPEDSDTPDPELWAQAVETRGVTVWNSVPALLEMTLDYLGAAAVRRLATLRVVLLSGDWIPLSLVLRVQELLPGARLYSLGGATEVSIWSNFYPVEGLLDGWSSVPYGYPLANQSLQVLDPDLEPAPTWAVGDLYLGGLGVAQGYLGDPGRTAVSFVSDPAGPGRLYRTGDLARYRPGGIVEFLGRKDHQVKIRGFRIELGEIEATLLQHPEVKEAVALVHQPPGEDRSLVAFATASAIAGEELRAFLADRLPSYMVPAGLEVLDALPLTSNGKVDRSALAARVQRGPGGAGRAPRTEVEHRLAALWAKTLGFAVGSVDEDFFELGGNSLLAVRLFRGIEEELGRSLPLSSLFRFSTIAGQASQLGAIDVPRAPLLAPLRPLPAAPAASLFLFHPVGGNVLCYRELARHLDPAIAVHGLRARGTETGEKPSPASSLEEMAAAGAAEIARAATAGILHLGGWSLGGVLAFEAARQLEREGREIGSLVLIDAWLGDPEATAGEPFRPLQGEELPEGLAPADLERLFAVHERHSRALRAYRPQPWAAAGVFYRAARTPAGRFPELQPFDGWLAGHGGGRIEIRSLPEDHWSIVTGEAAARIAREVSARLLGESPP